MKITKLIQMILSLVEYQMNHYDDDYSDLYHPYKYLWNSLSGCAKRTSYYSSLNHLISSGVIKKEVSSKGKHLKLTVKGVEKVSSLIPFWNVKEKIWDGRWRMIVYDIPEESRVKRDFLRRKIKQLGFGYWQKSAWISPFDISRQLHKFLIEEKFIGRVSVFEVQNLYGIPDKEVAASVWPLKAVAEQYKELVIRWNTGKKNRELKKLKSLAQETQIEYLKINQVDPHLPRELCPNNWPKDKVDKTVKEVVRVLLK